MTTLIIVIHVIACIVLIGLVLIQRGRGSGLVESFQGVESMFGTKTNTFLTRTTTILSIVFFISCLSLAIISVRQSKSLMSDVKPTESAPAPESPQPQAQPEANATAPAKQ
jgi:preprotein translocase subunit SecG